MLRHYNVTRQCKMLSPTRDHVNIKH